MRAIAGLVAVDALALLAGLSLLAALGLPFARSVLDVALAFVAGWAELGVAWTLAAIAGVSMAAWEAAAIALALTAAQAAVAERRRARGEAPVLGESGAVGRGAAFVGAGALSVVVASGLAVATTASADTEWDVWAFWLPKAKSVYYLGGLQDGPNGITDFASAEYPPLAAVVDAVTFHFAGVHPADLVLQRWLLTSAFFLGLAGLLLRRAPGALVWPPLAMLAAAPATVRYGDSLLADPLVATTIALAAVCGVLWLLEPTRLDAVLAGLFLSAAALVKTEGFLLGMLLVAFLLVLGVSSRRWSELAGMAAAPVLALLAWKAWLAAHDAPLWSSLYDFGDLFRPGYLLDRLDRLGYALPEMAQSVFSPELWLLSLPVALAAVALAAAGEPRLALVAGGWPLLAFLGLAAVYWISPLPVEFYVDTSAQRVLMTIVVVSVALTPLLLAAALREAPAEERRRPRSSGESSRFGHEEALEDRPSRIASTTTRSSASS